MKTALPPMPMVTKGTADRSASSAIAMKKQWIENAKNNRPRIIYHADRLWTNRTPKTGVLIAAGPSLKESVDEINALDRKKHEIVCVDIALKFLVKNFIYPDYVICSEASADIIPSLQVPLKSHTPLLLNVVANPLIAPEWKGPIYWFCMMSNYFDVDAGAWMQDTHQKASGCSTFLVPGGNVGSLGVSFLSGIRACRRILLYGHDFCWKDDGEFYAGQMQMDLAQKRIDSERKAGTVFAMQDTQGDDVFTNESLKTFASWYEDITRVMPTLLVNRTPSSIFSGGTAT